MRGIIVPIVDIRIKFNLGMPTYDQFTVVIIPNIDDRVVGMVVDSVSGVITLGTDRIKPAPEMGTAFNTGYLTGLGTIDERLLILTDIDKLMPGGLSRLNFRTLPAARGNGDVADARRGITPPVLGVWHLRPVVSADRFAYRKV